MKIQRLKEEIRQISGPRRRHGNLRHKLEDILIIGFCTIMCNGEDFTDMEGFGKERREWLSAFREPPNGIPDSDTFRRVFEKIKPCEPSKTINNWLDIERAKRSVVAVDGQTIRGSKDAEHKAYHVVSAWVAENQITLGEIAVDEKSNEITAVPELLDMLDVEGCIITADAMSCKKDIAKKITEKKSDYVLGLKGNQSSLCDDAKLYFDNMDITVRKHWSVENQLHWCLDVVFREDAARARKDNSPLNMNVLRKTALSLLKTVNWGRIGLKKKMFTSALNPNKLLQVLSGRKVDAVAVHKV